MAAAAWAGAWMGSAGLQPGWAPMLGCLAGLLVVGVGAALGNRTWLVLVVVVLLVTTVLTTLRAATVQQAPPAQLAAQGVTATVLVRMVGEPWMRGGSRPPLAVARAELLELRTRQTTISTRQPVVVFASGALAGEFARVAPGATYEVRGKLAPADKDAPEALVVRARSLSERVAPPGRVDSLVNALRHGLRESTAHSPPQQAALVPSLVVGDTAGITPEMDAAFKATSLSHLMAVSGANLSLMLVVLLALSRSLGARGWWVRVIAMAGVALFVLVCRGEPSVIRAAAMGLVAVTATGVGRGGRSVRNLALAVLCLMLVDPWLSRSWGFALSVAACFGIALWSPSWVVALSAWAPRWVAEALAVPLAAQLATQPLITALSGQVSVVGVLANVLAGPFVGPATVLGLAAMVTTFVPGLSLLFGWLSGWCVQPILWIAQLGSSLPSAAWAWPATPIGVILAVAGSLVLAAGLRHVLRRGSMTIVFLGALLTLSLVRPVVWGWPGAWQAVFCDVGQGDATVLRAGPGTAVLIDAGPDPGPVLGCLDSLGITEVPLLVLTHFHTDHIGGLEEVFARFAPDVVVVSPYGSPVDAAGAVRSEAAFVGSEVITAQAGDVLRVGDVVWTTVSAPEAPPAGGGDSGQSGAENDSSVVGVAEVAALRLVLAGDVEPPGQRRALVEAERWGLSLTGHVLKVPHHGSARQDAGFFEATHAALAVVSAGEDNDYGHPARAALDLALRDGMAVARTDLDGSIAVSLGEGGMTVRTMGG